MGSRSGGRKVWHLTTHRISPAVEQDRFYLLQDLIMSGAVSRFGFVQGIGVSSMPDPRVNLGKPISDRWLSSRCIPRHAATGLRSNRVSRLGASSPVSDLARLGFSRRWSRSSRTVMTRDAPGGGSRISEPVRICPLGSFEGPSSHCSWAADWNFSWERRTGTGPSDSAGPPTDTITPELASSHRSVGQSPLWGETRTWALATAKSALPR
jgi:hypothetical protein